MTMTSGQLTYTVHPQPGRNSTNQWKWGVEEDNQKTSWSEDWYPDEESARQAAEKHADESGEIRHDTHGNQKRRGSTGLGGNRNTLAHLFPASQTKNPP